MSISSNKSFFYINFYKFFFIYIQVSKDSSVKYQNNKERLQIKLKNIWKDIKFFLKEKN